MKTFAKIMLTPFAFTIALMFSGAGFVYYRILVPLYKWTWE